MKKILFLPVLAFCVLFLLSCSFFTENDNSPMQTISWETLHSGRQCIVTEAGQTLVSDQTAFASLLESAFGAPANAPEMPEVDFDTQQVLAAFMGTKNTGGFSVSVASISQDGANLNVELIHTSPGPLCFTTQAIEQPYIFILLDKTEATELQVTITDQLDNC